METRRLYGTRKRKREVFVKKIVTGFSILCLTLFFSVLICGNFVAAHNSIEESPIEHKYYKSIEIQAGDTLWDIAEEYMHDSYADINEYIEEIKQMNHLSSDDIHDSHFLTITYYNNDFK